MVATLGDGVSSASSSACCTATLARRIGEKRLEVESDDIFVLCRLYFGVGVHLLLKAIYDFTGLGPFLLVH